MHKHLRNRIFQIVLVLVILGGIFILGIRKHRESQREPFPEKVSAPSASQDTFSEGEAPPLAARNEGKSLVGIVPGLATAAQIPKKFPPTSTFTTPRIPENAQLENRLAEMDAFTAAKYLYNLNQAGTEGRMRALAAQASAENPDDVEVVQFWANLNGSHPLKGSNPDGVAARRKLLELRPNSPEALLELSEALWYTEPEETLGHLEKAEELIGPDDWMMVLKAKAHERMGEAKTALEILKTYREKYPYLEEVVLPHITVGGPNFLDFYIEAIEEGRTPVNPHPRYLEAPQGEKGAENVSVPPFDR
ncbi:hypothetical protein C6495_17570 [Candidatus Poribacteria bacterium]|nr:MAG: hypothetical protein C6495_17570 [Candidatus Poribacteria bacterium]